ncbi:MAG: hypothetical protein M5U31_16415 [Acidimicrobiia bacterium]|nr:hypothetical protein [Acidimicrobiia bacterium]
MLYNGRPHVFYYDDDNRSLRHAYYNGVAWAFETLRDGAGGRPGTPTTTSASTTQPFSTTAGPTSSRSTPPQATCATPTTTVSPGPSKHLDGHQNGPNGRRLANLGRYSAVVIYNTKPHVFYYDFSGHGLRHAYYNGVAWAFGNTRRRRRAARPHQQRRRLLQRCRALRRKA